MDGMGFDPNGSSASKPLVSRDSLNGLAALPLRRQAHGEVLCEALGGISVTVVSRAMRKEIVVEVGHLAPLELLSHVDVIRYESVSERAQVATTFVYLGFVS